jgi:ATP-binding cassette subfamily B protein
VFTARIRELFEESANYTEEWFEAFVSGLIVLSFDKGDIVFSENEEDTGLYFVLKGCVEFERQRIKGVFYSGSARKDEYIGEAGATGQTAQSYTARCAEDCLIVRLPPDLAVSFLSINKGIRETLLANIAEYDAEQKRQENLKKIDESESLGDEDLILAKGHRLFPYLRQHDETDCGAACLTMVSRFYKLRLSMGQVREMANVSVEGASMTAVCRAAENLGYRARGLKATFKSLSELTFPLIVHWQGFHYIVLYRIDKKFVYLADPAIGLRKLSHEEFKMNWTGFAIELVPTEKLRQIEPAKSPMLKFMAYLTPHKLLLSEIFMASVIVSVLGIAQPLFLQAIVDNVIVYQDKSLLNLMLFGMIMIAFFSTLTGALSTFIAAHVTAKLDLRMIAEFYKHVLSLPMKFFYSRKIGDITTRFDENSQIRAILTGSIVSTALNIIMLVVYTSMIFVYSVPLSLVVVAYLPFFIGVTLFFAPPINRIGNEIFAANAEQSSMVIESIQGIETIKANGIEWDVRTKWEERFLEMVNTTFRLAKLNLFSGAISTVFSTLAGVTILWLGANLVIAGKMSLGELMAFNSLIGSVLGPLMGLVSLYYTYQAFETSIERVNDVLDIEPEEKAVTLRTKDKVSLTKCEGSLEFIDITFRYGAEDSPLVLNGINARVESGKKIAIVGKSGSGKTTFIKLIPAFIRPSMGSILVDGIDINMIDLYSLRRNTGIVLQESFLFNATIAENIALGYKNPDEKDIIHAAKMAAADEFITCLPHGYNTLIGARGLSLSGGQKQRVCIARALFRNPKILIFDEATSALDAESERRIQESLDHILTGRTAFIIAHRLSTVRNADEIWYLENGVIVEKGNHNELMEKKGYYWSMASKQLGVD